MRKNFKSALLVAAVAAVALAGVSVGVFAYAQSLHVEPAPVTVTGCPTEDSCIVDYSHGAWTITQATP